MANATTAFFNASALNGTDTGWLDICVVGSTRGYIAPIGGDVERQWNPYLLGTLYFLGLCWCFLGVSIIADIFMLAIEKITSIDRIITRPDGTKYRVRTWNDTVANLTLMAMGSSAPEIMVNVVEITGAGFYSGDLGPSTVVGSAAFNLLVINAFCTFAILKGEVRRVKEIGVYAATSTTSILAYVWMVVILVAHTPDIVDTWEAAVTFAGFPLLVVGAYLIETKKCDCALKREARVAASIDNADIGVIKSIASNVVIGHDDDEDKQRDAITTVLRELRNTDTKVPMRVAMQIAIQEILKDSTHRSHAFHRIMTARTLAASGKLEQGPVRDVDATVAKIMALLEEEEAFQPRGNRAKSPNMVELIEAKTSFFFASRDYSVLESTQKLQVVIVRPKQETANKVRLVSREGTAKHVEDFILVDKIIEFPEGKTEVVFQVDIVKDNVYEDDEVFYLDLLPVTDDGAIVASRSSAEPEVSAPKSRSLKQAKNTPDEDGGIALVELTGETKSTDVGTSPAPSEAKDETKSETKSEAKSETKSEAKSESESKSSPKQVADTKRAGPVGANATVNGVATLKQTPLDTTTIQIIDDSAPGVLNFSHDSYSVCESDKLIKIEVVRRFGGKGTVSCKVKTVDREATSPDDYKGIDEENPMVLEFQEGEVSKFIEIEVVDDEVYEKDESFDVVLFDPQGGASLVDNTYKETEAVANVVIISDEKERRVVDKMANFFSMNYGKIRIGKQKYSQQCIDAIFPGGSTDCKASAGAWVLHIFAFPWKLLFAIIPPVDIAGGWLTFFLSLLGIAGATMFMADLAGLLGCVAGLPPAFTAISLVAIGTSIPDLFASMSAARADEYADASIGNVMGSNSVNVFMGLGLPWLIAAIYWNFISAPADWELWASRYRDIDNEELQLKIDAVLRHDEGAHGFFIVPANDLGFSVGVFCSVALLCLLTFGLRRKFAGGELGGPLWSKCVGGSFLLFLWLAYIGISGLYIFGVIEIDIA